MEALVPGKLRVTMVQMEYSMIATIRAFSSLAEVYT
jgi:hypothetical protein